MAVDKSITDLEKGLAAIKKQQKASQNKIDDANRQLIRLDARKTELERQVGDSEERLKDLHGEIEVTKLRHEGLQTKNSDLEKENSTLESNNEASKQAITDFDNLLADKKQSIDAELDTYSVERKKAVKADILATHRQLTEVQEELTTARGQVEAVRQDLQQLNQVAMTEQEELKTSHIETERLIGENKQKIDELTALLESLTDKVKKKQYEYDNLMIVHGKAQEQHDKFVTYEKQARKVLEAKDKQLQAREAELSQSEQFVANQRSFLPPM